MNSNTTPHSGNNAQRSSINNNHGNGSMLSQLEHQSHHDTTVKMSALHDSTAESRIAGDDFGGLGPKDYSGMNTMRYLHPDFKLVNLRWAKIFTCHLLYRFWNWIEAKRQRIH
ncbi:MAG: hypothetical protein BYD32DRAFT_199237 [Podila humilis]|nr:MAG: hypothetical protein BYD32DRAFT_199237 [Podila humilis]